MAKKEKAEKAEKEKKPSKSKIDCTKCGETKAVRPDVFDKRVIAYGDEEKLRAGYLCQKCRPKKEKASKKEKDEE